MAVLCGIDPNNRL